MDTPDIRFKGFTDDWEQRKLGDIAPLRGGFAFQSEKYADSGVPIVRISNILSDGSIGGDFAYYNEEANDSNFILKNGDALLAMSGATTGKVSVLTCDKGIRYYQNQRVGLFSHAKGFDYKFISTIVRSEQFIEQLRNVLVAGAQPNVSSRDIDSFEFHIPTNQEEQRNIGTYFSNLDTLITLHQHKLDTLKNYKKAMLVKMFPREGQKVPEIRFKGFTGNWGKFKLGDIASRVTRKNENLESDLPLTISAQYGLINQNEFFDKRIASKDVSGYYLIKNGEFAYNKSTSADAPWGAIKRLDRYEMGVLSTLYIVFSIKDAGVYSDYLSCFFETDNWYKHISDCAAEGARNHGLLNISTEDFLEMTIFIPADIEEQKKIGTYLCNLGNLITLHQQKLDKLRNLKQAMLNKMFVKGGY